MGIASVWKSWLEPKNGKKLEKKHRPFSFETEEPAPLIMNLESQAHPSIANNASSPRARPQSAHRSRPASHRPTLRPVKHKSEADLRKGRHRLGRGALPEDTTVLDSRPANQKMAHTDAATTPDESMTWTQLASPIPEVCRDRRKSIVEIIRGSGKVSHSAVLPRELSRRQSVVGGHQEMVSPPSSTTATFGELINPETGMVPSLEAAYERRKSRRLSLSNALDRVRSKSTNSATRRRMSWWHGSPGDDEEIPAVPPIPHTGQNGLPPHGRKPVASTPRTRTSWWKNNNPDQGDDPPVVPPVPSLVEDDGIRTPSSTFTQTSPDNSSPLDHLVAGDGSIRIVTRGTELKQPRPLSSTSLSVKNRAHSPRSPANGLLGPMSSRSSYRHSLLDDGEGGVICLSDEQQREWEKLQHFMDGVETRPESQDGPNIRLLEDERHDRSGGPVFSNADALAALEFGMAH